MSDSFRVIKKETIQTPLGRVVLQIFRRNRDVSTIDYVKKCARDVWNLNHPEVYRTTEGKLEIKSSKGRFSVSHTDNFLACLMTCLNFNMTPKTEIGIDLESLELTDFELVLKTYFSNSEQILVKNSEKSFQNKNFKRLWVHKEALVKASGLELEAILKRAEFDFDLINSKGIYLKSLNGFNSNNWFFSEGHFDELVWAMAVRLH
jgi:phosphopantetheinyl transferase